MSSLWVDTDLGFDDIHALLLLRSHEIQPVACSLVFGCATLDQVVRNAQGVENAFDLGCKWFRGAGSALDGHCRTAHHVLGESGMLTRGLTLHCATEHQPSTLTATSQHNSAVEGLINWLASKPVNPQILALGPLTNLAQLIIQSPQLAVTLSRITWMGGSCGRGNQTEHAEFNAWADAEAASIVMQSGIPVHLVELQACRELQLVPEDLHPLSLLQSPRAQLIHDLLGGYLDIALSRGRSSMALYDPLAAAAVILAQSSNDNILSSRPVNITIETAESKQTGRTYIQPAASDNEGLHSLCIVNNAEAAHDLIIAALYEAANDTHPDLDADYS